MLTSLYPRWSYWSINNGPFPPPVGIPTLAKAPVVTGDGSIGSVLTCDTGQWDGITTAYYYQWMHDDGTYIMGSMGATYTVTDSDAGANVQCEVVVLNNFGPSKEAYSNAITVAGAKKTTKAPEAPKTPETHKPVM